MKTMYLSLKQCVHRLMLCILGILTCLTAQALGPVTYHMVQHTDEDTATTYRVEVLFVLDATGKDYAIRYGGVDKYLADVLENMNQVLDNSGISTARYHMAGYYDMSDKQVSRLELGYGLAYADAAVRAKRRAVQGDIVIVLSEPGDGASTSGFAVNNAPAEHAYASVRASTAIYSYTAAHEAGHLFGCEHSRDQFGAAGTHAYAVGYNYGGYSTVMSYGSEAGGQRIPMFSGPNNMWKGVRMGSPTADNTRMMLQHIPAVSQYGEAYAATTDYTPPTTDPIYTEPKEVRVGDTGGEISLIISAGSAYTITTEDAWLRVTPTKGDGKAQHMISVQANPTAKVRQGHLFITNQTGTVQRFTIMQEAGTETSIHAPKTGVQTKTRYYSLQGVVVAHPQIGVIYINEQGQKVILTP